MNTLPKGVGGREYGKFRANKRDEVSIAVHHEDEASIETLNVTDSGDTEILAAPGATEFLTIKGFHFSNNGSKITVSLKAGAGGKELFTTTLLANGGSFDKNLIGRNWELPINKPLVVVLSGAGDVNVTVEYKGLDEPGEEAVTLTDSLSIAEGLTKTLDFATGLTDAQVLAAAVAKAPKKPLSDSVTFVESNVRTGDRFIALSDSQPITENVGNQTTTEISEADSLLIAEQVEITLIP